MNYKFIHRIQPRWNKKGKFLFNEIIVSIAFYKNKVRYRNAVVKRFENKKQDLKMMKDSLREWVLFRKKRLENERQTSQINQKTN